jgi:putative FmdB family regulatory protein
MPLYEYRCADCQERFEVLQSLGEGSEGLTCPRCGGSQVEKQFSTFSGVSSSGASEATSVGGCGGGSPFS